MPQGKQDTLLPWWPWIAVLMACMPYVHSFPQGHDAGLEVLRVAEYLHALEDGQYPPYWASNLYGGYGSPVFLYYAPLFSFTAAILSKLLSSFAAGGVLAGILFTVVSAASMMALMREVLGRGDPAAEAAARISTYLYVLSPYLMADKFARGANAEFTALAVLPLVLLGLLRGGHAPRQGVLILSIGLALVILAHNLTALAAVFLLLVAAGLHYLPNGRAGLDRLSFAFPGVLLGLALSAFFWWPALAMLQGMRVEEISGLFVPDRFPALVALFGVGHTYSGGPLIPAALILAYLAYFKGEGARYRRLLLFTLFCGGGFILLQTSVSAPLWDAAQPLKLFQFPWRMMGALAMVSAMAGGMAFYAWMRQRTNRPRVTVEYAVLVLAVTVAVIDLLGANPLTWKGSADLEGLSSAVVRELDVNGTARHEYLPPGAKLESRVLPAQVEIRDGDQVVASIVPCIAKGGLVFAVETNAPRTLRMPVWSFDVWRVKLNGTETAYRGNEVGSIDVDIPKGRYDVQLELRSPQARVWGVVVGMIAGGIWLILALLWGLLPRMRKNDSRPGCHS